VCQLRSLVYSLGLNNPPHICLTCRKSRVKNVWPNKYRGTVDVKWQVLLIHSLAKLHCQMLRFATAGITPWQTALKCTVELPSSVLRWQRIHADRSGLLQSTLLTVVTRSSVIFFVTIPGIIWARSLASEWNSAPAILHCHFFLTRDFSGVQLMCGRLFRPNLATSWYSWHTISWHNTFKIVSYILSRV
jgi:hypothetical protein